MSINTAKAKILKALSGMDIDCIDDAKTIRSEGLLLSFEGTTKVEFSIIDYIFGLYVSKKILNKKTDTIYDLLDSINTKIEAESLVSTTGLEISIKSIHPNSFENGILEYRCQIHVTEK